MGTSGDAATVIRPTAMRIIVPTLPLLALGATNVPLTWPDMPGDDWQWYVTQDALLGKATATLVNPTAGGATLRVVASLLVLAGTQVHVLVWS